MLNVVCVKQGTKYGPEFVNILYDMVQRNLLPTLDAKFICFTEDATGLNDGIVVRGLPPDLKGWWSKLYLFDEGLFPAGDRVVYFDLDTVITGDLGPWMAYDGEFAICRDFMREGWNSSIMMWKAGFGTHIYKEWRKQGMPDIPGGDQEWIERMLDHADIIQDLWPGSAISYKMDCMRKYPNSSAVAICFHGEPKPDNCGADWVEMIWKMGGGSAAELSLCSNTEQARIFDNIRNAVNSGVPWMELKPAHDGHAVIVCGGPSAQQYLEEIKWRKSIGQTIVSVNGSHDWLRDNGVVSDMHILLDARPSNTRFVQRASSAVKFVATQCDPELLKAAGDNAVLWQPDIEGIDAGDNPAIPVDKWPSILINGGTTVGLCAMPICYTQGFRFLHLYGYDSSYDGAHHAYTQPENDADRAIDVLCQGRKFKAATWMVAQANQFQIVANDLAANGCTITVHGDGLLPWIAKQMQFSAQPDTMAVEIDGIWWPSRDEMARPYILNSLGDIDKMLAHTGGRKVAVQAGGNVGIYPRELSKHFDKVVTFEPDPLNYECLVKNTAGYNVTHQNVGLGEKGMTVSLERDPTNCGAHYVDESGGDLKIIRLDDLSLDGCDLLQLDVEGYEFQALQGGEKTIDKYKPTIVLEMKGHGSRYGYSDDAVVEWLAGKGYSERARFGRDVLFSVS